jgi:hypothetical protein
MILLQLSQALKYRTSEAVDLRSATAECLVLQQTHRAARPAASSMATAITRAHNIDIV